MKSGVPTCRVRRCNDAPVRREGEFVLYWMIASRRTRWNFALERAADWALELGKPLLVLEALRSDYRWASERIHRFVLDGMRENRSALEGTGVGYYPYVEPRRDDGQGLLRALSNQAAVVVTDEFPCFFLPEMVSAAAGKLQVSLEAVDSNGLLPLAASDRAFSRAFDFRRHLQKELPEHLADRPREDPVGELAAPRFSGVRQGIRERWPEAPEQLLEAGASLAGLPIDHAVPPVVEEPGGSRAAERSLQRFVEDRLGRYGEERSQPDAMAASELSAYLHFGHISAHEVFDAVRRKEAWSPAHLSESTSGQREGWWGMGGAAESFLDELITWRELGYHFCHHRPDDYADYDSLPDWARESLRLHAEDERPAVYSLEEFEEARTHDTLWNAAQNELRERGRIHNYLRMLWGKKILHWTRSPREALDVMIELNNKYALDGRNPNSYSGIFWVLGRFDRAWGPERPIFGKIRYMTSESARRKLRLEGYLKRWGGEGEQIDLPAR